MNMYTYEMYTFEHMYRLLLMYASRFYTIENPKFISSDIQRTYGKGDVDICDN